MISNGISRQIWPDLLLIGLNKDIRKGMKKNILNVLVNNWALFTSPREIQGKDFGGQWMYGIKIIHKLLFSM